MLQSQEQNENSTSLTPKELRMYYIKWYSSVVFDEITQIAMIVVILFALKYLTLLNFVIALVIWKGFHKESTVVLQKHSDHAKVLRKRNWYKGLRRVLFAVLILILT